MSVYKDDVMKRMHELVGDGHNVRHALAILIKEFDERKLAVWAETVFNREVQGNEDPRDAEVTQSG